MRHLVGDSFRNPYIYVTALIVVSLQIVASVFGFVLDRETDEILKATSTVNKIEGVYFEISKADPNSENYPEILETSRNNILKLSALISNTELKSKINLPEVEKLQNFLKDKSGSFNLSHSLEIASLIRDIRIGIYREGEMLAQRVHSTRKFIKWSQLLSWIALFLVIAFLIAKNQNSLKLEASKTKKMLEEQSHLLQLTKNESKTIMLDLKKERDQSEETKRLFAATFHFAPTGLIMTDSDGTIIEANHEAVRIFGYSKFELEGKKVEILVPPDSSSAHPRLRAQYLKAPERRAMGHGRDLYGLKKNGETVPVEIGLNPITLPDGRKFVLSSIIDISQRKEQEATLNSINKKLYQKNQELEQFVYMVSHDLKAPLVTIEAFLSYLREDIDSGNIEEVLDSLERLSNANAKMKRLIEDLLKLSRVGLQQPEFERVSIKKILEELSDLFKCQFNEEGKELIFDLKGEFPDIEADKTKVSQIFENLFSNAISYSDKNSIQISVSCNEGASEVEFVVSDNGPGIPESIATKVFELFQRGRLDKKGTGIGLSIVKKAANVHGGDAWLDMNYRDGASFHITLNKTPSHNSFVSKRDSSPGPR